MRLLALESSLEANDDLHIARLLLLLSALGRDSSPGSGGLVRIAKLDFFLRYPACLERALNRLGVDGSRVVTLDFEQNSVESQMAPFRYGPWDLRYRRWANLLIARGLIRLEHQGPSDALAMTPLGETTASRLSSLPQFKALNTRAMFLKRHLSLNGTALTRLVYFVFPEISSLLLEEAAGR